VDAGENGAVSRGGAPQDNRGRQRESGLFRLPGGMRNSELPAEVRPFGGSRPRGRRPYLPPSAGE
jgi:hypothetical protein